MNGLRDSVTAFGDDVPNVSSHDVVRLLFLLAAVGHVRACLASLWGLISADCAVGCAASACTCI